MTPQKEVCAIVESAFRAPHDEAMQLVAALQAQIAAEHGRRGRRMRAKVDELVARKTARRAGDVVERRSA
jgi:hypothetical protein